jgi:hypothetical protein
MMTTTIFQICKGGGGGQGRNGKKEGVQQEGEKERRSVLFSFFFSTSGIELMVLSGRSILKVRRTSRSCSIDELKNLEKECGMEMEKVSVRVKVES